MATSYTGLRVQDTYNAIIKIGDNSNLTATPKLLSDGLGNDSPLYLSGTRLGIGISPAYQFHTSGNAKIGGDVIISGDLTVNGDLTYLNVTDLAVEDPLIKLAKDNTANTLDIGLFGKYVATGTKYKGFFNDASDDKFKLFIGSTVEPGTTVDTSASGYTKGNLVIGNLEATGGDFSDTVYIDDHLEIENSSGYGYIELGGSSGGYIDLKGPFSNDFDLRVFTDGTNSQINAIAGALDITANSGIDLQYQGNNKLTVISTGIDVTGNLFVSGGIKDSDGDLGTSGQLLSSTGTGTNWIDFEADVAKRIDVTVKNVSGGSLAKGVVVHAAPTATPPSGNVIEVIAADANVAASMPAIGVLNETIADEAEGEAVMFGAVSGIDTSSFSIGDELYVSETAGEFTATKPTAFTSEVQKIAVVIKSHASNGLIKVFGAGRSNDVPNRVDRDMNFTDDSELTFGDSSDLKIYHTTNNIVRINSGDLIFNSFTTDGDIKFQLDNGSSSVTEYLRLDGGTQNTIVTRPIQFNGYATSLNIFESYFARTGNPNSTNTNLYLADSTDMADEVGGSIVFSGKYKTDGTYLSGGPFIRGYKENANDSNYSFGLKFGIRLNGSGSNDTALTIKPNKDVVVSEGDLKVDSSSGDSAIILDNSSQILRIDQNSIRTTTDSVITFLTNSTSALQLDTSQNSIFYGDLYIPENIIHTGDTDTYIKFRDNRQTLGAGGTEFIDFANTTQDYITIGGSSDIDTKVQGGAGYIFIQGSDGFIGINDITPTFGLDINSEVNITDEVYFRDNRTNFGGSSTFWYASTTNARINWDARVSGDGVMIHKWNRNADNDAYLPYEENWYDGNSYHKISAYNDGFLLNGNITLESYGSGNITGTLSKLAGFESTGKIIDVSLDTFIDGSGTTGYIPYFTDASSIASTSVYYENADKVRHIATIGPNDSVRKGFFAEDDTDMAADVGGQIGFRYKYTSSGAYTEGALIRMYKENGTTGHYGSGLKFQVRNNGDELSSKMTLNPSGFLGLGITSGMTSLLNFAANQNASNPGADNWSGSAINTFGGDIATGRVFLQGHQQTGNDTIGFNVEASNRLVLYNYTDSRYLQIWNDGGNIEMPNGYLGIGVTPDSGNGGLQITKTAGTFANSNQKRVASFYDGSVNSERPGIILGYDDSSTPHGIIAARTQSGTGTIPGLQFFTYNGSSWGAKMTILSSGKVGIGTTSSNGNLSVQSTVNINDGSNFTNKIAPLVIGDIDGVSNSRVLLLDSNQIESNGDSLYLNYNSAQNVILGIGGGNVGINTTPVSKFHLKYASGSYGSDSTSGFINEATSGRGTMRIRSTTDNPAELFFDVNGGIRWDISCRNGSAPNLQFYPQAATPALNGVSAHILELQQTGNVVVTGNGSQGRFAVGTTVPSYKFTVQASINDNWVGRIYNSNTNGAGLLIRTDTTAANDKIALGVYSDSAYKMVVRSTGNVGISTVSPTAKLQIESTSAGAATVAAFLVNSNTTVNTETRLAFAAHTNSDIATNRYSYISTINTSGSNGQDMRFATNATGEVATEKMRITSAGNIGIGTNSVVTAGGLYKGMQIKFGNGASLVLSNTSHNNYIYTGGTTGELSIEASQEFRVRANGSERMRITSGGNVYIADTTAPNCCVPTPKFYVNGTSVSISAIGPNDNVRSGLAHYDSTTGNGAGVGGQLVLGYRYSGTTYTEGAIIKMYKTNSSVGNYSSGLKFQVRNNGESLSSKMTLTGNGDLSITQTFTAAGDVIAYSDIRVKENIITIDNALEKVTKLRGVSYNRIDTTDKSKKIGVIAQEVNEVLPEVINYNEEEDRFGVDYGKMAGVFIEAIKDLKSEIDSLKQEIKELKK